MSMRSRLAASLIVSRRWVVVCGVHIDRRGLWWDEREGKMILSTRTRSQTFSKRDVCGNEQKVRLIVARKSTVCWPEGLYLIFVIKSRRTHWHPSKSLQTSLISHLPRFFSPKIVEYSPFMHQVYITLSQFFYLRNLLRHPTIIFSSPRPFPLAPRSSSFLFGPLRRPRDQ